MAAELTATGHSDLFLAAAMNALLYESIVDRSDFRSLVTNYGVVTGSGSLASEVSTVAFDDAMGAANADEVTAPSNVDLGTGLKTLTVARQVLKRVVTDPWIVAGGVRPGLDRFAQDMAGAASLRLTDLICALFTSVTAHVNGTGTDLTVDDVSDASYTLIQARCGGQRHLVLSPIGFTDFLESLRGEGGSAEFSPATEQMLSAANQNAAGYGPEGSWRGINFYSSDSAPTVSSDRVSCMFTSKAFGLMEGDVREVAPYAGPGSYLSVAPNGSPIFVEFSRLPAEGHTIVVGNYYCGVGIIDPSHAVKLTNAAT